MRSSLVIAVLLLGPAAFAQTVRVGDPITKIHPDSALPAATSAVIEAVRNEFEPFQIVVAGPATIESVTTAPLVRAEGGQIDAANVRPYQVALFWIDVPSNSEGSVGYWPDPLVPARDVYAGEVRNAFPMTVPAGEVRAVWIDVYVPQGTTPGVYRGDIQVAIAGQGNVAVPVELTVHSFDLPSTSTLHSAFGFAVDLTCRAFDDTFYCMDEGQALAVNDASAQGVTPGDWAHLAVFARPSEWNDLELVEHAELGADGGPNGGGGDDAGGVGQDGGAPGAGRGVEGGCGCGVARSSGSFALGAVFALLALLLVRSRRRE